MRELSVEQRKEVAGGWGFLFASGVVVGYMGIMKLYEELK